MDENKAPEREQEYTFSIEERLLVRKMLALLTPSGLCGESINAVLAVTAELYDEQIKAVKRLKIEMPYD